ncbi:MAG: hypothetical protein ACKO37_04970 [Vampirovibrionales bacterium]
MVLHALTLPFLTLPVVAPSTERVSLAKRVAITRGALIPKVYPSYKPDVPSEEALFQYRLTSTDPLLHGAWRYIGYSDDLYESGIGTLASAMTYYNKHNLRPQALSQPLLASASTMQGLDPKSTYAEYIRGLLPAQLKTLAFLNTAIYALCNAYCVGDSALTAYRAYHLVKYDAQQKRPLQSLSTASHASTQGKSSTDIPSTVSTATYQKALEKRAVAKGIQLFVGQYLFHYLASYTLPALVIRDIVYKNIKQVATGLLKLLPSTLKQHQPVMDLGVSSFATLVSVASMPWVARYLDPMCEKVARECFYQPTNQWLNKHVPDPSNA